MALVRWEPTREIHSLQQEVNRLFGTFFDTPAPASSAGGAARRWVPAMDLLETEDQFVLKADLPGVSQEDVAIEVEDRVLTVSGERKAEHEERGEGWYRLERASGTFSRSLTLPAGVAADGIVATFDRGVLEVRIPKPEARRPQRIQISAPGQDRPADVEGEALPA